MDNLYHLPTEFETERFLLRRVEVDDSEAIFNGYATDAKVVKFLGWRPHRSVDETEAFLKTAASEWEQQAGFPVVAFFRNQPDDLIGMFHPHVVGHRVNYGYVLRASAWNKGCASEIMSWLVDHALSHPAIFRAEAFCDLDNAASARVMEKAGMTREGILRCYFRHPNISDKPRDCAMYSKVK